MYLEIPVLAAARFAVTDNQNVVVKAGPYFAFGVAGKVKVGDEKVISLVTAMINMEAKDLIVVLV